MSFLKQGLGTIFILLMRKLFTLALICSVLISAAQKQWSNWVGQPFGITFRNGYPLNFNTNSPNGGIVLPIFGTTYYNGSQAVAYSDSLTGQIKFLATNRG